MDIIFRVPLDLAGLQPGLDSGLQTVLVDSNQTTSPSGEANPDTGSKFSDHKEEPNLPGPKSPTGVPCGNAPV